MEGTVGCGEVGAGGFVVAVVVGAGERPRPGVQAARAGLGHDVGAVEVPARQAFVEAQALGTETLAELNRYWTVIAFDHPTEIEHDLITAGVATHYETELRAVKRWIGKREPLRWALASCRY